MKHFITALERCAATNKRSEKLAALKALKAADYQFSETLLSLALDPFVTFGLDPKKVEPRTSLTPTSVATAKENLLAAAASILADRDLTGNAAKDCVAKLLAYMTPEEREVCVKVLDKDLRCGVRASLVNEVWPGLIPVFSPMLCKGYKGEALPEGAYIEPKIDGIRMLLMLDPENPRALSRNGKELKNMQPLVDRLMEGLTGPGGVVIDGELFAGSWEASIAAGKREGCEDVGEFWAFDCIPLKGFLADDCALTQAQRVSMFWSLCLDVPGIQTPAQREVRTAEEAYTETERLMSLGFEGGVVKDPRGLYRGGRKKCWYKITRERLPNAESFEEDYEIVGLNEGKGKWEGMLGSFVCRTVDGTVFNCSGRMSEEVRREYWQRGHDMVGLFVEAQFRELTPAGVPRFPIFMRLREDKA